MASKAVKTAKKTLKKVGDMKLKELAAAVVEKKFSKTSEVNTDQVRAWIQASKKFQVNGKVVTLTRKRSSSPDEPSKELAKSMSKENKKRKVAEPTSIDQWRTEHKIVVLGDSVDCWRSFDDCSFDAALIAHCRSAGFIHPTPIQAQAWPILAAGADAVAIAETGSGKTLGFALPALSLMLVDGSRRLPRMLVLSPTRELAMQSDQVLSDYGAAVGLQSVVVYGGVPKYQQTTQLKKGVDCVVGTPGRLKDLIDEGALNLSQVQYLVLDEADRMLDMGFEEDVRQIIQKCRPKAERQTAMFSATWPAAIQKIAGEFMTDPARIYVGFDSISSSMDETGTVMDDSLSANKRVKQVIEVIEDRERPHRLEKILRQVHDKKNRVLVFALYKKEAERLEYVLKKNWNCCSIHGNKNQPARTAALAEFKSGACPLLIATDVAARGLDIPNVEVVINYTFPLTIEDYVRG